MRWAALPPAAAAGFAGAFAGAWVVTVIDPGFLRRLLPFILLAVLIYTLNRKELGRTDAPRFSGHRYEIGVASLIGIIIGFYDGFFGPGTCSFPGVPVRASAGLRLPERVGLGQTGQHGDQPGGADPVRGQGPCLVALQLPHYANVAGSLLGTRLALKHGAGLVRGVFIVVVTALILKTGYDAFMR